MTTPQPPDDSVRIRIVADVVRKLSAHRLGVTGLSPLDAATDREWLFAVGRGVLAALAPTDGVAAPTPADPQRATFRDYLGDIADSLIMSPTLRFELIDDVMAAYRELHPVDAAPQDEPLHEVSCPQCGATIRARMADAPDEATACCDELNPDTGYRCRRTPIHDAGKSIRKHVQIDKLGQVDWWITPASALLSGGEQQ